jgi:hypothetical protein
VTLLTVGSIQRLGGGALSSIPVMCDSAISLLVPD